MASIWLGLSVLGFLLLVDYDTTPGAGARAPRHWASTALIEPLAGKCTLVMFAHPHCPCTRASIAELSVLMTRCQDKVHAIVLFLKPGGFPPGWEKTDLWYEASRIPGVTVTTDEDGAASRQFAAVTSGQTFVYSTAGSLLFSGGITASRGHAGDNEGLETAVAAIAAGTPAPGPALVFGCPLIAGKSGSEAAWRPAFK